MVSCSGSLVQSCQGEGGALQTNITSLCGEHWQYSGHTEFSPTHGCVLSPSTLLRFPAVLYGAGPALRAVPVFGFSTKAWTWLGLHFVPSPPKQFRQPGAWWMYSPQVQCTLSPPWPQPQFLHAPVGCVSLVSAGELASSSDPSGRCRPSRISGSLWLEAGTCLQFGRDAISGAEFAPFPSPLPPASSRGWASPPLASSSLEFFSSFVLQSLCSAVCSGG